MVQAIIFEQVMDTACEVLGVEKSSVLSRGKGGANGTRRVVLARKIIFAYLHDELNFTQVSIRSYFGRSHASAQRAISTHRDDLAKKNNEYTLLWDEFKNKVAARMNKTTGSDVIDSLSRRVDGLESQVKLLNSKIKALI